MGAIPLKANLYSIPGGLAGTQATLRAMRSVALSGAKSPTVRTLALSIVKGLPARDTLSEAKALYSWVRNNVRFVQDVDNVETIQTTDYTLAMMQGDCDDKTDLLAALSLSIGLPFRFVVVGSDPAHFCHVLGQVNAGTPARWYFVEPSEPGTILFGQQARKMPAMRIMDVSSGQYVSLGALGDVVMQYGFDPFQIGGGFNDITKAQWDTFFSNVTGDAHDRLVTAGLQSPSLEQAFIGMVTGLADPWINFDTTPTNPYKSQGPGSPTGTEAGKVYTGVKTKLQGLGAIPGTSWNWLYNAVKSGAAKASLGWSNGSSLTRWNQQFNSQQRLATQIGDVVAVVASAVGIGEAAGALSAGTAGTTAAGAGAGTTGATAIAPTTVAVDTSGVAASAAAPTIEAASTTVAASTLPTLSVADIGTAAATVAASAGSAAAATVPAAAGVADTIATVTKAATALVGTDLAVKTAQAEINAQQQAATTQAATALKTAAVPVRPPASRFLPLLLVAGIGAVAYLT